MSLDTKFNTDFHGIHKTGFSEEITLSHKGLLPSLLPVFKKLVRNFSDLISSVKIVQKTWQKHGQTVKYRTGFTEMKVKVENKGIRLKKKLERGHQRLILHHCTEEFFIGLTTDHIKVWVLRGFPSLILSFYSQSFNIQSKKRYFLKSRAIS